MMIKLSKSQNPCKKDRSVGIIIDCDEISISIFPPPREHGRPHCHVRSKKVRKVGGREQFPELKIFLDGSGVIAIMEGFSERDFETIGDVIFNDPPEREASNDEYLLAVWEELHRGQF